MNKIKLVAFRLANLIDDCIDYYFDRKYNLQTIKQVEINQFNPVLKNILESKKYQASRYRLFFKLMKKLQINPLKYNFIDYGSGKGRTLFLAKLFNFKKIYGIEFEKSLYDISTKNLNQTTHINNRCINLLNIDVEKFKIPTGPNVYYFYNPFEYKLMHKVLSNILKESKTIKEDVFIYLNPKHQNIFLSLGLKNSQVIFSKNFNKLIGIYRF